MSKHTFLNYKNQDSSYLIYSVIQIIALTDILISKLLINNNV